MTTKELTLADVDFNDPELFTTAPPHEHWKLLRREAPVFWHHGFDFGDGESPGYWCITKYDDVMRISRDPATFISSKGIAIGMRAQDEDQPPPTEMPSVLGKMMIMTDPPRHVRLRRLVNKGFTPRAVAEFEPKIRAMTTEIIDDACRKSSCDFVTEVAAVLPLAVICGMMGVPKEDWPLMFELTNKVLGAADPEYQSTFVPEDADIETRRQAIMQTNIDGSLGMYRYFQEALAERRKERRDDLVSVLIDSEIDGEKLSDEEILFFCFLLIVAGNETTRNAISGGLLTLFEHPEQMERLKTNPGLMPTATEEILRWISPVTHMTRVATRDVEIRGMTIKEDDRLAMWYPAVNRDEDVFPDPDTFDITRSPNEHLAFGIGEHFCLGAGFARLEIRVMFEELLQRLPDVAQDGPPERLASNFIGGIKHLPVRFTPTA
jgi:cytochrome P450